MTLHTEHQPVMLEQVIAGLAIKADGTYVDATYGRGGHSAAILAHLDSRGSLYVIDRDPEAVAVAASLAQHDPRVRARQARFGELAAVTADWGIGGRIDGLLVDLGVSSPQLDDPVRGFSFLNDGPLDMRMDPATGVSAADWLNTADADEIARVVRDLGEERYARRIARAIDSDRRRQRITGTRALADLISRVVPTREPGKHPATRTFQAIRIFVNGELDELRCLLDAVCDLLARGARLAVISFHSLEDRIVKRFMRDAARGPRIPPGVPVTAQEQSGRLRVLGKPQRPNAHEVAVNPRARSAILRIAEVPA